MILTAACPNAFNQDGSVNVRIILHRSINCELRLTIIPTNQSNANGINVTLLLVVSNTLMCTRRINGRIRIIYMIMTTVSINFP